MHISIDKEQYRSIQLVKSSSLIFNWIISRLFSYLDSYLAILLRSNLWSWTEIRYFTSKLTQQIDIDSIIPKMEIN